jgi:DNA-binding response OmpR family regulator
MILASSAQPALQRPVILWIDDDPNVSIAAEVQLRHFDVKLVRAFHGKDGFEQAMRIGPDVIIVDLAMPNGDGTSVVGCLRHHEKTQKAAIIVLTGMRDRALARQLFLLGADQFLHKPVSSDELLHEISRFVDLHPSSN